MKSLKKEINNYNEFDGQAILTINDNGEIGCTVGQSECYVNGYKVLFAKSVKEEKEFWVTEKEVLEKVSELK